MKFSAFRVEQRTRGSWDSEGCAQKRAERGQKMKMQRESPVLQGGEKEVYCCEYAKQSLLLYYYLCTIVLFFHTNNCKPTFLPPYLLKNRRRLSHSSWRRKYTAFERQDRMGAGLELSRGLAFVLAEPSISCVALETSEMFCPHFGHLQKAGA